MNERNNHFDFDFTPIGQAIKKAREAKGMTREQLSGIIGYAPRQIQSIENEGQYPSIELFIQLITMFDVSVDEYIYRPFHTGRSRAFPNPVSNLVGKFLCFRIQFILDISQLPQFLHYTQCLFPALCSQNAFQTYHTTCPHPRNHSIGITAIQRNAFPKCCTGCQPDPVTQYPLALWDNVTGQLYPFIVP